MGLFTSVVKAGVVAVGVVYGQRLWDASKLDGFEEELHFLEQDVRCDKKRTGTVAANMQVRGAEVVAAYRNRLFLAATVAELELRFKVYIQSIVEPPVGEAEPTTASE